MNRNILCSLAILLLTLPSHIGLSRAIAQQSTPSKTVAEKPSEIITVKLLQQQIVDQGRGFSQVFVVTDEQEIHHAGNAQKIVVPKNVNSKRLGYMRIYFKGRTGKIDKGIIVLIDGYDTPQPKFYVDQNNNLDFTDDGSTEVTEGKTSGFVLKLLGDNPASKFQINLIPFRDDEGLTPERRKQYAEMFRGFESYVGGKFADPEFWFYNRRLNTLTNSVTIDGQNVMLGLHDYDCDGLYSGAKDRLLIGTHGADTISDALADGAVNAIDGEIFLIGKQPYRIVDVADDGSSVQIAKTDEMPDRLYVGSPVPNFRLKSFDGKDVETNKLIQDDRLLILDFWGHWCGPCISAIPSTIKFHEKWKDRANIVGVHMGEHDIAKKMVHDKEIPFVQFESTEEIQNSFFIDAWPTYVVIDGSGKLISFRSNLKDIEKLLSSQSQSKPDRDPNYEKDPPDTTDPGCTPGCNPENEAHRR